MQVIFKRDKFFTICIQITLNTPMNYLSVETKTHKHVFRYNMQVNKTICNLKT